MKLSLAVISVIAVLFGGTSVSPGWLATHRAGALRQTQLEPKLDQAAPPIPLLVRPGMAPTRPFPLPALPAGPLGGPSGPSFRYPPLSVMPYAPRPLTPLGKPPHAYKHRFDGYTCFVAAGSTTPCTAPDFSEPVTPIQR